MRHRSRATTMTCSEFQHRFSDYYDGTAEPSFLEEADAHLGMCPGCRRYHEVLHRGFEILRAAPPLAVPADFLPRLQHRIYHLEDGPALSGRGTVGSATTVTTALAIAMLIALAAWSPVLVQAPEVDLAPIVVDRPEPRALGVRPALRWELRQQPEPMPVMQRGLWDDPLLFTRYSPLTAARFRQTAVVRRADL